MSLNLSPRNVVMTSSFWRIRRPIPFLFCLLITGVAALSVHVGMLAAGVPFPLSSPPLWARWLSQAIAIGALLAFLVMAQPRLSHLTFWKRTLVIFVVLVTIREVLRGAIMNGVVTTGWVYSMISLAEPLTRSFVIALLCAFAVRWVRSNISLATCALVIGALAVALQMITAVVFAPVMQHFAWLSRPDAYQFPYPTHVTILAYLTFYEAVFGATVMTALVWDRLPGNTLLRLLEVAALVALVKGVVGGTLLFSFHMEQPVLAGMLSYSQFLFEFLVLGLLGGLSWVKFGDPENSGSLARTNL